VSSEDEKEIEKDEDELNPDIEFTEVQKLVTYLFPDGNLSNIVRHLQCIGTDVRPLHCDGQQPVQD
jgi:hypothetical protein